MGDTSIRIIINELKPQLLPSSQTVSPIQSPQCVIQQYTINMRTYKTKSGGKPNKKTDPKIVESALQAVKDGMGIRKAANHFGISKSSLQRKCSNKGLKENGGQTSLSPEFEAQLVDCLLTCSDFNMMLTVQEVQMFVKYYLDHMNIKIKRFKNNRPGIDWVHRFLRDAKKLTNRICPNVKKVRYNLSPEKLNKYFDNVENSLEGVPPSNVINYDETNFSDDPGASKMLMRRGVKYPSKEMNFSKSSTTVMYAGTADGKLVPPYVIFKSTHLYKNWCIGGPKGTSYNRSKSGWIDGIIFIDWLEKHIIPWMKANCAEGIKVLIGDNLSSHISPEVTKLCEQNEIRFVLLEPNTTHMCQPLDVAVFRPVKRLWRNILKEWKESNLNTQTTVPKEKFPALLKKLVNLSADTIGSNLQSGFKACGLVPANRNEVMKAFNKLVNPGDLPNTLTQYLQDQRQNKIAAANTIKIKKGKWLAVEAGKSVKTEDLEAILEASVPAKKKAKKRLTCC